MSPNPLEILRTLIRFDTSNPPGNETECVRYIASLLTEAGIPSTILARDPLRANLAARLAGRGAAPPLLLYGHADVVATTGQTWTHPPFAGEIADGCLWGRGTLDMKGGLAMMIAALLQAREEGLQPAGDLILAVVADEECLGGFGAHFLVEEHPALFHGVQHAISEFGGFPMSLGPVKFYPVQVAEKQICRLRLVFRGPGGHGSLPLHGGAMARLGQVLVALDGTRLPVHVTPPAEAMIKAIARALPAPMDGLVRQLLDPESTDAALETLAPVAALLEPILRHTVNATVVRGGEEVNVIPSTIDLMLDGRLLPGFEPADLVAELHHAIGEGFQAEVIRYDPGPPSLDLGLFPLLDRILREVDPAAVPLPFMARWVTDARFFARLGIQSYGFTPMNLPPDFDFNKLAHAADERIPLGAVEFGTQAILRLIQEYGT